MKPKKIDNIINQYKSRQTWIDVNKTLLTGSISNQDPTLNTKIDFNSPGEDLTLNVKCKEDAKLPEPKESALQSVKSEEEKSNEVLKTLKNNSNKNSNDISDKAFGGFKEMFDMFNNFNYADISILNDTTMKKQKIYTKILSEFLKPLVYYNPLNGNKERKEGKEKVENKEEKKEGDAEKKEKKEGEGKKKGGNNA